MSPLVPTVAGPAASKNEEVNRMKGGGQQSKLTEQASQVPGEGGGQSRLPSEFPSLAGFVSSVMELSSAVGVLSRANKGFGHISVYLLGYCSVLMLFLC